MHIAIAGNIGSGKTTLTKMLAKRYGWKANFEPVDNNPYLADYYKDMERWSFNLQIYFLDKRFMMLWRFHVQSRPSYRIEPSSRMRVSLRLIFMISV